MAVGKRWEKSSYSAGHGECLEARRREEEGTTVDVRDTQHRQHGHLTFSRTEWSALMGALVR